MLIFDNSNLYFNIKLNSSSQLKNHRKPFSDISEFLWFYIQNIYTTKNFPFKWLEQYHPYAQIKWFPHDFIQTVRIRVLFLIFSNTVLLGCFLYSSRGKGLDCLCLYVPASWTPYHNIFWIKLWFIPCIYSP